MRLFVNDLLSQHLAYEREQIHLITTLYGITAPNDGLEFHLKISKCFELMKASTLIIDDFLDKSPVRNGIPSLYSKLGAEEAVLIAELLKSSATIALCQTLAETPNLTDADRRKCMLLFEDTYRTVCLGQLEEIRITKEFLRSWFVREKEYWQMIKKTTAVFIQLPLLFGATVNHYDESTENALWKYGLNIGLAYQVRDDVIDIIGEPEVTGKPLGGDIRERKIRLPLIHCLLNGSQNEITALKQIYKKNQIANKDIDTVIEILNTAGSIQFCVGKVKNLCVKAIKVLPSIQDGIMIKQLKDIASLIDF